MKLVYVLGTDGAGKTTVLRRLTEQTFLGSKPAYLYCQHRPLLMWLLKLPARLFFMRKTDAFEDYESYKSRKDLVANKHRLLTRIYILLGYFDSWLQTWPRLLLAKARGTAGVLLVDRYYLDWVVNAGELQHNSLASMLREAHVLECVLPKAHLHVFLDVSEETAFARKNDIQSVQYLSERKRRYLELAAHYQFQIVDANQDCRCRVSGRASTRRAFD